MKKHSTTRNTIKWFWHFTRPDKKIFIGSTTFVVLAMIANHILPPLVVARAFNELQMLYSGGQKIDFWQLDHFVWAYISLLVTGFIISRIQTIFAWLFEIRSAQRIMEHVFDHIQRQSTTFHANHFGGALVSHANKFVAGYERLMDDFTWSITTGVTALLGYLIVLSTVSWQYALLLLLGSMMYLSIMGRRTIRQMKYDRAAAESESQRTAKLADNITNVSTVRAFAGETTENNLFHKQTEETKKAYFDLFTVAMKNQIISHSGTMTIQILAFSGGLIAISLLNAPFGTLFLTVNYTMSLSQRLWESDRTIRNVNRVLGDASSMTEILELEPEIADNPNAQPFTAQSGQVTFSEVSFQYSDGNGSNVFEKLNLEIPAGQRVGLVGPSGGGKSTITKLIMRFMDIQAGAITIDGQDISKLRLADLRASLTTVPQEPMLFHRTIAQNISYGKPNATPEEIERVAKLAHAHEFIQDMSHGYQTMVGERGVKLSGGQRQRIAIARAMLHNAPILILDEATSALDSESEALIQDALWKLMDNKTAIVIAHRLSTIQKMDRIIVMDKGMIVEDGTHHDLLKKKGLYARLWAHQSGGFIEE